MAEKIAVVKRSYAGRGLYTATVSCAARVATSTTLLTLIGFYSFMLIISRLT